MNKTREYKICSYCDAERNVVGGKICYNQEKNLKGWICKHCVENRFFEDEGWEEEEKGSYQDMDES